MTMDKTDINALALIREGKPYTPSFSVTQLFTLHRFGLSMAMETMGEEAEKEAVTIYQGRDIGDEGIPTELEVKLAVRGLYKIEIASDKVGAFRYLYEFDVAEERGIRSKTVGGVETYGHSSLPENAFYGIWTAEDGGDRHFVLRFETPFDFDQDPYNE